MGRRAERDQLDALIDAACRGGTPRGAVLHGPPGIGKTSLALDVLHRHRSAGRPVERLVASPSTSDVPLLWLAPLQPTSSTARTRIDLVHELRTSIAARCADGPLLVVLDDAHLLDVADVELLAHLIRDGSIVLLATARSGEPGAGRFAPLFVDGSLVRIDLGPLDRGELEAAAVEYLESPIEASTLERLWHASAGVPLFARELIVLNVQHGSLVERSGSWTLVGEMMAPPTLVELLADRCRELTQSHRRTLETLALAQPLPAGFPGADLVALAELEDLGVVTATLEQGVLTVRLGHPLYADAILSTCGPLRTREIAERARVALEHLPMSDPDRELRIVTLCVEHDLPVDDAVVTAAAARAVRQLDPELAERLVGTVRRPDWSTAFVHGAALAVGGRVDEADVVLERAFELASDDEQRARAASRRANCLAVTGARFDDALDVLDRASEQVSDPRWRAFLDADRAYTLLAIGRPLDLPMSADASGLARANECLVGAVIAAMAGRHDETEAYVTEGLTLVHHLVADVPTARELLNLSRFISLATTGRAAEAAAIVETELDRAGGRRAVAGPWLGVRALQHLLDGRPRRAADDAAAAAASLSDVDVSTLRPFSLAVRATALAQLGVVEQVPDALEAISPTWRDETKARLMADQATGWVMAMNGRTSAAAKLVARAARRAFDAHHAGLAMIAAHDAARFGHPSAALPLLRDAARQCEGELAPALLEHAVALDAGDPDRLMAVAAQLPVLGFSRSGAEAATAAADRFDRARRSADAVRARAFAGSLLERLEPIRTPGLGSATTLTARERQIAELAAQRRRSREIADELGISVRTVDNHLVSVYRKLGLAGRAELERHLSSQ